MSYSESAYERYNEVRALAARASCIYESRSPDGDLVPASWRPRPARDRSPAGTPV
ncbi:unnamed protein product, partial [Brassica oleracea var. botrytis]